MLQNILQKTLALADMLWLRFERVPDSCYFYTCFAEDLSPALADMKRKLMERNVAEEISQNICDSVARCVEGREQEASCGWLLAGRGGEGGRNAQ